MRSGLRRTVLAPLLLCAGLLGTPAATWADMITTTPSGTVVLGSGARLNDFATLSGLSVGVTPFGTIEFQLFAPGVTPGVGNPIYSDILSVAGNGPYNTLTGSNPGGFLPSVAGVYEWIAGYSGDPNNLAILSGVELQTVTAVSTVPEPASIVLFGTALLGFGVIRSRRGLRRRKYEFTT